MKLKPHGVEAYERYHDEIWLEMLEEISRGRMTNYSIFRDGLDLFAYLETDNPGVLATEPSNVVRRWWRALEPYMEYESDHRPSVWPMKEVFHAD